MSTVAQATFSLRDLASSAPPFDGTVALTWTPLTPLDEPSTPGAAALLGRFAIPGDDVSLTVAAAPTADAAIVALTFDLETTPAHFGPGRRLSIAPVWTTDGHIALLPETAGPTEGRAGFRATLSVHSAIPDGTALSVEMDDVLGHQITVRLLMDGPMQMLLRRIGKGSVPAI